MTDTLIRVVEKVNIVIRPILRQSMLEKANLKTPTPMDSSLWAIGYN